MTRTDLKTPTTSNHKHDHGLGQVDAALAGKAATTHGHPDLEARLAALEAPIVVPPPVVDPPPDPPPPSGQRIVQFPGTGQATPAAFVALAKDLATDVIEIAGGTYLRWACFPDVARPADHPLLIRPAPGAAVVWDGGGGAAPPWRIGWAAKASYLTFDPAGTGGSFTIQNYSINLSGLVMSRYFDHVAVNGVRVRSCTGTGSPQTSHCVYVGSSSETAAGLPPGLPRSQHWTSDDWDVVGPAGKLLCGFQTEHTPSADHVTANRWKVSNLHRATYVYADPTDVTIDGWTIADCTATVDTEYSSGAQGVVRNCHATNSGPLARGQGRWIGNNALLDGGGNTSA